MANFGLPPRQSVASLLRRGPQLVASLPFGLHSPVAFSPSDRASAVTHETHEGLRTERAARKPKNNNFIAGIVIENQEAICLAYILDQTRAEHAPGPFSRRPVPTPLVCVVFRLTHDTCSRERYVRRRIRV